MNEQEFTLIDGIRCYSPDVASEYSDYPDEGFELTDSNSKDSFWVSSRNRLFKKLVNQNARKDGKTKLLEIGCGTGNFIEQMKDERSLEITGSEIYIKGLQYAKANLPEMDFVQFDVTHSSITEKFDMIVAFDVLEHIEKDMIALNNINQMLLPDGKIIISVPQHMFLWSSLDDIVKHKRRYSRKELVEKLESVGFSIEYVTSFVFLLFPLMFISRLFDKNKSTNENDGRELEKRVLFSGLLNSLLDAFMRVDEYLIDLGVSLPVGGTLVVVASKPITSSS